MARVKGEVWDDLMSDPEFRKQYRDSKLYKDLQKMTPVNRKEAAKSKISALQSTAEGQRKAYQRDGRLGRATGNEMTKAKPKYQSAPTPPRPPRKGGGNMDKGYQSSNPAKNRPYPGTVGQYGKALEQAYNRGRADGARMAGAKTTSIKGRIPLVRQVRPSRISPVTGAPIRSTGGGIGRGGARGEFRVGGGGGGEGGILRKKIR